MGSDGAVESVTFRVGHAEGFKSELRASGIA